MIDNIAFARLRDLAEVVGGINRRVDALEADVEPGTSIRLTGTIGNGVDKDFVIPHGLGTRFVDVKLFENSGDYLNIEADVKRTTLNAVTISFKDTPTPDQFGFVLVGPA
ncbi:hypothetical protein L7H23_01205 [Sphingopyxis sp. BSN-002]|uniref:hypothetical protein n=1 Tax=Sphingopyxis sp. BSN-002 TaxID=2911495 RepID=UPI001EDA7C83|nr:hypothetical protein [Sphingopyxis sp. BSN-002]UKK84751.1 hypothetical protein L7H23_01205 [Sphingopyxis sp. BSN-002]